jgi:hypothetical protein
MGEEHDDVYRKRMLRIFGPREKDTGWCSKLHNKELPQLYSSPYTVG